MKRMSYKEMLPVLEDILSEYGGQELQFPDGVPEDVEELTEPQAELVFDYNEGDVDAIIDYLETDV